MEFLRYEKKHAIILLALVFSLCATCQTVDSVYSTLKPTKELFYQFCNENSILYPEVVWAQARHESGNFTSTMYKTKKNCLGLYDSYRKRYMSFNHWTDCLIAYRDKLQYRYTGATDDTDTYLSWLTEIGYAEDPEYITRIKNILRKP